eukprot:gene7468-5365_t
MAHIKTLEDFKKNMVLVDKGIAENNGEALKNSISIAISWLHYAQIINKCVEQIFLPTQPFYMKLAQFDKPPEIRVDANSSSVRPHDPQFIESLDLGSCVDCLRKNNIWEMAVIEKFSDTRTECEICFNDDERIWISLSDYAKYAPFGTKTGLVDSAPVRDNESSSSSNGAAAAQPPALPLTACPTIGDLVDARNANGVWYQGCVMDIREEEQIVQMEIAPVLDTAAVPSSDAVDVNVEGAATNTNETDGNESAQTTKEEDVAPATPVLTEAKIKKTFLRIAFVGFFESSDEWIDLASDRVAVLNSTSLGRRGEYSLRDEIFHRAFRGASVSADPAHANEIAFYMDYSFTSPTYVQLVRHFYGSGGFHQMTSALQAVNNPAATCQVELAHALPLIRAFSHLSLVLSQAFKQRHQTETLRSIFHALHSITQNDIRSLAVEDIESGLQALETFFYRLFDRQRDGIIIENFYLEFLWHFLRCPFLNRRLGGLKSLQELLKRASIKSLYPDGLQRIEISKERVSFKVQKITYGLTLHQICEYIMKQNILDVLYLGNDTHDSLIERSGTILRNLALTNQLDTNHYLGLMRAGLEKNRMILKVLPEMVAGLQDEKLMELLDYIAAVDTVQVNQELVDIVASVVERVKILSAFLFSWPTVYPHPSLPDNAAPFAPKRMAVVAYLVENANIFAVVGNAIIAAKQTFSQQHAAPLEQLRLVWQESTGSLSDHEDTKEDTTTSASSPLPPLVSATTLLPGTRASYGQHLEQLLDMVHLLFRSLEKRRFPVDVVDLIWDELVRHANILEEFESAMNFVAKIPTKIVDTNHTGLFRNRFFTSKNFKCIEKWFRWINSELQKLSHVKDGKIASVFVDPAELIGVDAFVRVCFETWSETVANASVTMITSLTRAAKDSQHFREKLVAQAMRMLEDVNRQHQALVNAAATTPTAATTDHTTTTTTAATANMRSLKRPLMLLDGLIDESYLLSARRLYPHASLMVGNKAHFKISGTSKNTKSFSGEISLHLGETVEDLFKAVARQMKLAPHEIKIFRQGRELLPSEYRKTISQLPMAAAERSSLVVAERSHKTTTTSSTATASATATATANGNEADASSAAVPAEAPAAVSDAVVHTPVALAIAHDRATIGCFFELLSKAHGESIDHLWKTLGQLPTAWHIIDVWHRLPGARVQELIFAFNDANMARIGELIYVLQIIELILYPVLPLTTLVQQYSPPTTDTPAAAAVEATTTAAAAAAAANPPPSQWESATRWCESFVQKQGFQWRALAEDRANTAAHTFMEDFLARYHGKKVLVLTTPTFSDDLNLTLRLQQIREKITQSLESQERRLLPSSMQDLLCLWTAISLSNPALLQQTTSPQQEVSFAMVFHAVAQQSSSSSTSAAHESSSDSGGGGGGAGGGHAYIGNGSVVDWFPTAFLEFVQWVINQPHAPALITHSIHTLLHLRPAITLQTAPAGGSESGSGHGGSSGDKAVDKFHHFFALVSQLLQVTTERRWDCGNLVDITRAIVEELRLAVVDAKKKKTQTQTQGTTGGAFDLANVTGNLSLCIRAASLDPTLLASFSLKDASTIVELLVHDVLGFGALVESTTTNTGESSSAAVTFHLPAEAKKVVYEWAHALCAQHPSLAIHVYQGFKRIHHALHPPTAWEVVPDRSARSRWGYVGLKNFGATCYMNSLLQVLFANGRVRRYILDDLTLDEGGYTDEELRNHLWYQLQKVFCQLQFSEHKAYAPSDWTFAFKDETGVQPLNTMMQQDAQEFLQVLFERCETMMQQHWRRLEARQPTHGMRTQQEQFVCISIDLVDGQLSSSLEAFVKGETISDFTWKEDLPKCEIVKKQCLAHLSDSVIFHLKRFKYNFDTFHREKINDSFAFPLELDMKPYTREGQPEFQPFLAAPPAAHQQQHHHPHRSGENSPTTPTATTLTSPLSPEELHAIAQRSPAYYAYTLAGVVVHTGTADSGHYYAYLKDTCTGQWYECNDSEISSFDIARLEAECFGGKKKVSDYIHATQSIVETYEDNPKNACRVLARDHLRFYGQLLQALVRHASTAGTTASAAAAGGPAADDNTAAAAAVSVPSLPAIWTEALRFLFRYALHTPHSTEVLAMTTQMTQFFASVGATPAAAVAPVATPALLTMTPVAHRGPTDALSVQLLSYLCDEGDMFLQGFFAPNVQYREAVLSFMTALFTHAWFMEKEAVNGWIRWQNDTSLLHGAPEEMCVWSQLGIFDRMIVVATTGHRVVAHPTTTNTTANATTTTTNSHTTITTSTHHQDLPSLTNGSTGGPPLMDLDFDPNEDPELLLALKLSTETATNTSTAASTTTNTAATQAMPAVTHDATSAASGGPAAAAAAASAAVHPLWTVTNTTDFPFAVVRFLIELTQDARLQWIPDDWRKAAQFVSFLATTLRVGGRDVAQILVRRDVIGQLLDIFLGDVSPLKGRVYFTGSSSAANGSSAGASSGASTTTSAATSISITRKRAPSSLLGRGSQSLLELAATMVNQSHKAHFLLTFIRSFVALLSRLPEICHVVATPIDNTEEEREIAWSVRAERTYELLALRLFEWGLEPDTWIATPVPAVVSTTSSSTALVTTDVPIAGPVMRVTADGLVPVSTATGGTHTGSSSSLTHANRSSVQNTSTNSLRSTDAVDGDVPTDMNYHEIFTDDMVNDNLSVGGHGSVGHVPSTASTVTQVGHDMGVGTQTSQMAVDDDDIPIFVDGMTDEEFELALARGGMFQ